MDFQSPSLRSASAAVHIFGASILAYCIAARTRSGHLTLKDWRQVPWARWCILLVFLDSWLFHVCAGLLIQGHGVSENDVTCTMAIFLCIIIYCLSKILIYSFLIERVYVVWPHNGTRLSSKAYLFCLVMMLGYGVVIVLMIIGKNAFFDHKDKCLIGLKPFASIPLLSYDLFLNVFLTSMFLWPLQQAHFRDARLRKIASRTLIAALVALTTSTVNIAVLTIRNGEEPGWICLASCGLDVTINALVLYCVTGYRPDDHPRSPYLTTVSLRYSTHNGAVTRTSARSDPLARPELSAPAPVLDKAKPYRYTEYGSPMASVAGPGQAYERNGRPSGGDRSIDHPIARASTIESVSCERRLESGLMTERRVEGPPTGEQWWWGRWRLLRRDDVERKVDTRVEAWVPFEISVTTVHHVRETSRSSCGSGRRDSASTDGGGEVCQ